jgi:hypothetical protein
MVEYGNGVGQVAGQAAGGHGGSQQVDLATSVSQAVADSIHTVSTLPPGELLLGLVLVLVALIVLRRAF